MLLLLFLKMQNYVVSAISPNIITPNYSQNSVKKSKSKKICCQMGRQTFFALELIYLTKTCLPSIIYIPLGNFEF